MASNTSGRTGVVALLSRYTRCMIYLFYLFPVACPAGIVSGKSEWRLGGRHSNGQNSKSGNDLPLIALSPIALPLIHGHVVVGVLRPQVLRPWANQPVIVKLLDHVGGPPADARDCKHRGKQILVD